jgi:tRNA 2-selenouridine synthase
MYELGMSHARDGKLLVYCWRGGKRSESVASLLAMNGLEVSVLEKGYKAFRQWALAQFERPLQVRIVGGRTGSGKTKILRALRARGEQTVDLEALADHRGSAFGRLGLTRHVTQMQFENDLAMGLSEVDASRPLWLEDESRNIGRLIIPEPTWLQMRAAKVWYIELPEAERLRLLMEDYGDFSHAEIKASLDKIAERLGGLRYHQALAALEANDGEKVAAMTLEYYDKTYGHGLGKRPPANILRRHFEAFVEEELANWMIQG